ncbi:MAG: leucine--tRNA ligase [Chlamydiae bacterium RIFCSPHIGHO2_12_FULL_49_11]|nr:MAG: leucine--tRNA ligase [Chlamydiae bacterium RIFCSPHIGHO2_12_FULL_49_11]
MKKKYYPDAIEPKWQEKWKKTKAYSVEIDRSKPKYYVLDMFPYPSGAGLHVGHVVGYTGSDAIARYKWQRGFNVLHPMGWDSFGLQAEQYAIRTGTHPQITTEKNMATYKRQLQALGFAYDWDREVATSDPSYYKWTQWIFTKLYEKGLAYEAEVLVNFCPALGTVLANEEVENGKSIEGGFPVERRPLKQWILKITAYADRLLEDLPGLDWPDHLKKLQENWIGRSEGANIRFKVDGGKEVLECYTTRADTIGGVTFLAISPEHPLVSRIISRKQRKEVEGYQRAAMLKSDLERTDLAKEKTGVFTGGYVVHPITGNKIPVYVADYVLMHYAKGAVMGVPSDDSRDFDFAGKYELPIAAVKDEEGNYLDDVLPLAGKTEVQAKEIAILALEKRGAAEKTVQYKLRDWLFSRQRYWGEPFPIYHYDDGTKRSLELDELPLTLPMIEEFKPSGDGSSPLRRCRGWIETVDPKTKRRVFRESNTMPQWAGSCWYYLRFCDPKNSQEAWSKETENYWMPVDLYIGGVEHAVLHLLYARFWHKVLFDLGLVSTSEPFRSLRNQGLVTSRSYKFESGGYVSADEVVEEEGVYIHKASGKKLISQIEKMSKSKFNGVSPDEIIDEVGADSLRLYVLFMTPFDKEKVWQMEALMGCRRFLNRLFDLLVSEKITEENNREARILTDRLIAGVTSDLEGLAFNTAIAKMMEFLNNFSKLNTYPRECLLHVMQLLFPFAPHFAEEGWEMLGGEGDLVRAPYPNFDPSSLEEDTVNLVFQVMGKVRGQAVCKKGLNESEALSLLKQDPNVQRHLTKEIRKVIYVPDKLINVVL